MTCICKIPAEIIKMESKTSHKKWNKRDGNNKADKKWFKIKNDVDGKVNGLQTEKGDFQSNFMHCCIDWMSFNTRFHFNHFCFELKKQIENFKLNSWNSHKLKMLIWKLWFENCKIHTWLNRTYCVNAISSIYERINVLRLRN